MRRTEWLPLSAILLITAAALIYTFVEGNEPHLGLDLQGGVSVVLQPTEPADDEALDQSIEIMRRRVDALGVAEPEVARQGDTIIVQLPGVDEPQRALELIGQTAELRFRPVLDLVGDEVALTEPEDDDADATVVLSDEDGLRYELGPTALTGSGISDANALLDQGVRWLVQVDLVSGPEGIEPFNELASICFARQPACPTGQLGIVLDGTVISAPVFQTSEFEDSVTITGDFTQEEAQDLALVLRFGALPVELEPQQTQTVSATLGRDALEAGVIAGILGLVIVAVYMISYYRLLGGVAMLSLGVSFALLWSIISWLGETQGLALTLAGVTGLIVAIGVSVDSNIVYFENVKEDVREGRPMRSSVERSFKSAFSTIVKADVATLIGAALLYWLTIGPVRGFAFYLGLATILDLIVSYYLMRPMVVALGRSRRLQRRSNWLGIPIGAPVAGAAPAAREPVVAAGGGR